MLICVLLVVVDFIDSDEKSEQRNKQNTAVKLQKYSKHL